MRTNKVGLVMTAYNSGEYIFKSLMSIANQTVRPDIIVVDDASTDNTIDEVYRFKEQAEYPLRLIQLPHNLGAGLAKRVGIEECENEFITFLDSDDFLPRRAIEMFLELQGKYDADMVCGGVAKAEKGEMAHDEKKHFNFFDNHVDAFKSFMTWELCNLFANSKLIRKSILGSVDPYSENRFEEDTDSVYKWFWKAERVVVDTTRPFYLYNIRPGSLVQSRKDAGKVKCSIDALLRMIKFVEWNCPDATKDAMIMDLVTIKSRFEVLPEEEKSLHNLREKIEEACRLLRIKIS